MKRAGDLFERIVAFENLHRAAYAVLRGKRRRGAAADLFLDLEGELLRLQRELRERSYQPGPYRTFWITDPKRRLISAAPIRDRIVHHALVQVIEPIFERAFIHHSYACRVGKGNRRALAQFARWARAHRFVLKLDVKKFFPSIDHVVLKDRITRRLKDPSALWLISRIVDASNPQEPVLHHFPGDDLFAPSERPVGLPIGNLTSQFFANVLLDDVDHFVKDRFRAKAYLRYVDDLAAMSDDKPFLCELRHAIRERLLCLRLRLNERKSRIRRASEGIEFLGFVVRPGSMRLNQTAVRRARRRIARLRSEYTSRELAWGDVAGSLAAFEAHADQGTTRSLVRDIFRAASFRRGESPADHGRA